MKVSHTIKVGGAAFGVAVNTSTQSVYVTNSDSASVSVIIGVHVIATIPVGGTPLGVGVDGAAHTVYVANADDGTISVISSTTNEVVATLPVNRPVQGVAVDPSTTGCTSRAFPGVARVGTPAGRSRHQHQGQPHHPHDHPRRQPLGRRREHHDEPALRRQHLSARRPHRGRGSQPAMISAVS